MILSSFCFIILYVNKIHPQGIGVSYWGRRIKKRMRKAVLDKNMCDRSPFCPASRSCKLGSIKRNVRGFFDVEIEIDKEKCTGCGVCTKFCPQGAIKIVEE